MKVIDQTGSRIHISCHIEVIQSKEEVVIIGAELTRFEGFFL